MTNSGFKIRQFWKPLAIVAAIVFVYAVVLSKLGQDWWTDENYSHGLIVPFVIGFIIWLEFDNLKNFVRKPAIAWGVVLVVLAFALMLAGTLGAELFTQRISLVLMICGIVVYFFGAKILRKLVVPFALLLLSIPIPQIIFNKIAFPLQIWASQAAIWGIRLFEIPSVRKGNVIELLPKGASQIVALEVVEACSGIRSLMTLVTLALILAYFTREKRENLSAGKFDFLKHSDFWRTVILMLSAIPIAIVTNAARVSGTGILTYYYGKQIAEGNWHEFSGWLVFIVALLMLIAVNWALKKAQSAKCKVQSSFIEQSPITSCQLLISNFQIGILIVALLFGGAFINWLENRGELLIAHQPLREIPAQIGDWRQMGSDTRFSPETESVLRTSDYVMRDYGLPSGATANLYVGFYDSQRSGATYHSPQNCLPGSGWEMKNPELVEIKTASGKTFTANRYIVQNGEYREVLIYWYQGRGRRTASEYQDKIYTVVDSLFRRRSDGALVRIMTPMGNNEAESLQSAIDLSAQISDNLVPFVPE